MFETENRVILVLGGAKSGKSRHALQLAEELPAENKVFVATCVPFDEEMQRRVSSHQSERGVDWLTVEAPLQLVETVTAHSHPDSVVLVDCITLWINNLLHDSPPTDGVSIVWNQLSRLIEVLDHATGGVILVSNEVGTGIVPQHRSARDFRDVAGRANQRLAACADQVDWVVAGIPVRIK